MASYSIAALIRRFDAGVGVQAPDGGFLRRCPGARRAGAAAAYARQRWATLKADHVDVDGWTDHNKVYLPLRPPAGLDPAVAARAMPGLRRVLAIWRPVSSEGTAFKSEAASTSVVNDKLVPAAAEVFSASLYLRSLRDQGETRLVARLGLTGKVLKAVDELFDA